MAYFSTCVYNKYDDVLTGKKKDILKGKLYIRADFYIDFDNKKMVKRDSDGNVKECGLTDSEFDCLCTIIKKGGKTAKYKSDKRKGDFHPSNGTVHNYVSKIYGFDKDMTNFIQSDKGKGYHCKMPEGVSIFELKKIDINDNTVTTDEYIKEIIKAELGDTVRFCDFIDSIAGQHNIRIGLEPSEPEGKKDSISGFLFELHSDLCRLPDEEQRASINSFDKFLILLLYQNNDRIKIDNNDIIKYRLTDTFESRLLEGGPFDEFSDDADALLKFYYSDLYDFFNLSSIVNSMGLLGSLTNIFKDKYYNDDSLRSLHKQGKDCDKFAAGKIYEYLKNKQNHYTGKYVERDDFAMILYSILFYISHGFICEKFHEVINGIDSDRNEFNKDVLDNYGCLGNPGLYSIYRMANRPVPNAIAVFEAAELEYYGRGPSKEINYEKAFYLYKKGCYDLPNFNPLSAWSYAYMLYNYQSCEKELVHARIKELEDEIEKLGPDEARKNRKIAAIEPTLKAFNCGCYAAANILGQMVDDADIPDDKKLGFTKSKIEYFEYASKGGYVFAKNQLYLIWEKRSEETSNPDEKEEYKNKAIAYLKESADMCEPYACNKYADLYLINEQKRYDLAFRYFADAYNLGTGKIKAWAACNLLKNYFFPYDNGEMELTDEMLAVFGFSTANIGIFIKELTQVCEGSEIEKILNIINECKKHGAVVDV